MAFRLLTYLVRRKKQSARPLSPKTAHGLTDETLAAKDCALFFLFFLLFFFFLSAPCWHGGRCRKTDRRRPRGFLVSTRSRQPERPLFPCRNARPYLSCGRSPSRNPREGGLDLSPYLTYRCRLPSTRSPYGHLHSLKWMPPFRRRSVSGCTYHYRHADPRAHARNRARTGILCTQRKSSTRPSFSCAPLRSRGLTVRRLQLV